MESISRFCLTILLQRIRTMILISAVLSVIVCASKRGSVSSITTSSFHKRTRSTKMSSTFRSIWFRHVGPCVLAFVIEYSPYMIDPVIFAENAYCFRDDEQVYFPHKDIAFLLEYFCVAAVNQTGFDLITCKRAIMQKISTDMPLIVSSIFLLITFVVYSVLRELRNMPGYLLRGYIASQIVVDWRRVFESSDRYKELFFLRFIVLHVSLRDILGLVAECNVFPLLADFRCPVSLYMHCILSTKNEEKNRLRKTFTRFTSTEARMIYIYLPISIT